VFATASSRLPNGEMTSWQRDWCTSDHLQIYLSARPGSIDKAADILASTLVWREAHRDVLSGARVPRWQGDMRVLTRSDRGYPVIYFCMANQVRFPSASATIEHMALVLESAVKAMRDDAITFDVVADIYGFNFLRNLDPRPTIGLMEMLKQPFRDRLRHGFIVDAPRAFSSLWNIAHPYMSTTTRKKIRFVSQSEAVRQLLELSGATSADVVKGVMEGNRAHGAVGPWRQPSELI